jgi:hypothetical protein
MWPLTILGGNGTGVGGTGVGGTGVGGKGVGGIEKPAISICFAGKSPRKSFRSAGVMKPNMAFSLLEIAASVAVDNTNSKKVQHRPDPTMVTLQCWTLALPAATSCDADAAYTWCKYLPSTPSKKSRGRSKKRALAALPRSQTPAGLLLTFLSA